MRNHTHDLGSYAQGQGRDQVRGQKRVSAITKKTTEANLTKLHRKIEHYDKVFHAQELGSYALVKVPWLCSRSQPGIQGHY